MTPIEIMIAVGLGVLAATLGRADAKPTPPPFPMAKYDRGTLRSAARAVEQKLRMPGFADFAESVAVNESRFNNLAIDDGQSALDAARRGYDGNPGRYGDSPYPRSWYTWGTGGWYQLLPSTALASREWNHEHPMLVFTPLGSTLLLASFIQRVKRNHFENLPASERNWLAIRRFMLSNKAGYDYEEKLPRTTAKRERYARDLEQVGVAPSFMYEIVPSGTIRATPDVYQSMLDEQGIVSEL